MAIGVSGSRSIACGRAVTSGCMDTCGKLLVEAAKISAIRRMAL